MTRRRRTGDREANDHASGRGSSDSTRTTRTERSVSDRSFDSSAGPVTDVETVLQRRIGNQALNRLYGEVQPIEAITTRPTVRTSAEREAERTAVEVRRASEVARVARDGSRRSDTDRRDQNAAGTNGSNADGRSSSGRSSSGRSSLSRSSPGRSSLSRSSRGPRAEKTSLPAGAGRPLPAAERRPVEDHLGYDLSDVRVHTGPAADRAARSIDAEAYTVGRDVVFAAGRYRPETRAGRTLLAHELTHVVQQAEGRAVGVQRRARFDRRVRFDPRRIGDRANDVVPGPDARIVETLVHEETFHRVLESTGDLDAAFDRASAVVVGYGERLFRVQSRRGAVRARTASTAVSSPSQAIGEARRDGWRVATDVIEPILREREIEAMDETRHTVLDLRTGEQHPVKRWHGPDGVRSLVVPDLEERHDRLDTLGYRDVDRLAADLGGRYQLVDPASVEPTEYIAVDYGGDGNRYPVWNLGNRYVVSYVAPGRHGAIDLVRAATTTDALRSRLAGTGLTLVRTSDLGSPTSARVTRHGETYEVRAAGGGYVVDMGADGVFETTERDPVELVHRLPRGVRVIDENGLQHRQEAGGIAAVPTGLEAPSGGNGFAGAVSLRSPMATAMWGRPRADAVPETPLRMPDPDDPRERSVRIVSHDGERERVSLLAAASMRETWYQDVMQAYTALGRLRDAYAEYLRREYSVGERLTLSRFGRAAVATISEGLGGASFDASLLHRASEHFGNALLALTEYPLDFAYIADEFIEGQRLLPRIEAEWNRFRSDAIGGAETAIAALEGVQDASKYVIETAAKAKFGPVGAEVVGALYEHLALESATEWAMTGRAPDWGRHLGNVVVDAVKGIIIGKLKRGMTGRVEAFLGKPNVADLPPEFARVLEADWNGVKSGVATVITEYLETAVDKLATETFAAFETTSLEELTLRGFFDRLYDALAGTLRETFTVETFFSAVMGVIDDRSGDMGLRIDAERSWRDLDVPVDVTSELAEGDELASFVTMVKQLLEPLVGRVPRLLAS